MLQHLLIEATSCTLCFVISESFKGKEQVMVKSEMDSLDYMSSDRAVEIENQR
jgi:hypothetical protein